MASNTYTTQQVLDAALGPVEGFVVRTVLRRLRGISMSTPLTAEHLMTRGNDHIPNDMVDHWCALAWNTSEEEPWVMFFQDDDRTANMAARRRAVKAIFMVLWNAHGTVTPARNLAELAVSAYINSRGEQ